MFVMKNNDLLKRLEQYRVEAGLTKTELSRLLGCKSVETYTNWLGRDSLPGAYVEIAKKVLGDVPSLSKAKLDLIKKIDSLNEEDKATILRLIDSLLNSR